MAASLNEKLKLVKTFDDEIIENYAVGETEAEIEESDEINSRVMEPLRLSYLQVSRDENGNLLFIVS